MQSKRFTNAIKTINTIRPMKSNVSEIQGVKVENNMIISTDLDVEVGIKTDIDGNFYLQDASFGIILKSSSYFKDDITTTYNNDVLEIKSGNKTIQLHTKKNSEFFPDIHFESGLKNGKSVYKTVLNRDKIIENCEYLIKTAKDDYAKPLLAGICFNNGYMYTTDGHRVTFIKDNSITNESVFCIPIYAVRIINDLFEQDITLEINDKYFKLSDDNNYIVGRLITGEFRDMFRFLNITDCRYSTKLNIDNQVIQDFKYLLSNKSLGIPVRFDNGSVTLDNDSAKIGINGYKWSNNVIGLNPGFLKNVFDVFKGKEVEIKDINETFISFSFEDVTVLVCKAKIK